MNRITRYVGVVTEVPPRLPSRLLVGWDVVPACDRLTLRCPASAGQRSAGLPPRPALSTAGRDACGREFAQTQAFRALGHGATSRFTVRGASGVSAAAPAPRLPAAACGRRCPRPHPSSSPLPGRSRPTWEWLLSGRRLALQAHPCPGRPWVSETCGCWPTVCGAPSHRGSRSVRGSGPLPLAEQTGGGSEREAWDPKAGACWSGRKVENDDFPQHKTQVPGPLWLAEHSDGPPTPHSEWYALCSPLC